MKKNTTKKVLTILLTFLLISNVLTGCGKQVATPVKNEVKNLNQTGFPIVNDKITLKIMGPRLSLQGPWKDMDFFNVMEQKSNIKFEYMEVAASGWQEKLNLAFAGNDLPDIIVGASYGGAMNLNDEDRYGAQGYLQPLEKLISKYAPNIQKRLNANPELKRNITSMDGHIYSLPEVNEAASAKVNSVWVNKEWLDNLGITTLPKTVDEFYTLLKTFKDKDANKNGKPDEIPLTSNNKLDVRNYLLSLFGFTAQGIEIIGDKAVYTPIEKGYKDYLDFTKKLYAEGLLDKNVFSHTDQQMYADGKENKVGIFYGANPNTMFAGKAETYPAIGVLSNPNVKKKVYPMNDGVQCSTFIITKNNKYPEASIRWADYFWTEEGELLVHYGSEGKYYKWTDSTKTMKEPIAPPKGMSTEQFRGSLTVDVGTPFPKYTETKSAKNWIDPFVAYRFQIAEKEYMVYGKVSCPKLRFTEEEQKRITAIGTDLSKYVAENEAAYITGQNVDWDKYVSTIKKMGIDEYVKIYQTAYTRWKNAK